VDSGGPKEQRVKPWFHVKIKLFKEFQTRAAAVGRPSYFF